MRLLAIGDIHGHLAQLKALMEYVAPTQEDMVVFLGDYVDRGPDSPGVIEYLIGFGRKFPRTMFLGGNHDHLLLNMLQYDEIIPTPKRKKKYVCIGEVPRFSIDNPQIAFMQNGGYETVEQYGGDLEKVPQSHIDFLSNCRLYHEVKAGRQTFLFVHAGIRPGIPIEHQAPEDLLWIRDTFYFHGGESGNPTTDFGMCGKIIVHGHDPFLDVPGSHPFRICLDSGVGHDPAVFDDRGKLTCCDVLTRETWQIDNLLSKSHKSAISELDHKIPKNEKCMRVYSVQSFGQLIKARRKELGLTQVGLGKLAVIDQKNISLIENGNPASRLDTILRLLSTLKLDLFTEAQPPPKELTGDDW